VGSCGEENLFGLVILFDFFDYFDRSHDEFLV
jgi:hypothetical protein